MRPFTYAEAIAVGVSPRTLRGQRFRRLHREVYICADIELTLEVRIRAALLILPPDTVVTRVTALRWYGLDVGRDGRLHFSTTHPHQLLLDGVVVHRRKRPSLRTLCRGLPTAGLQRFVDVVHDHGVRRARRAMVWVRERVESPRETVLRLMIVFARLPEPEPNVPLGSREEFVGRPDLVYLRYRVIVEYDGAYHFKDRAQRHRDIKRREKLEALGWRVYRALHDRGYQGPPPVFNDMWSFWFAAG